MWRRCLAMKRSCGSGAASDGIGSECPILRRLDLSQTQVFCRHLCPTQRIAAPVHASGLAFFPRYR